MTGKLLIDGRDAYTTFGVFVADGGYNGLVQYPSLKTPDSNNWPEQDGIEVDLSDPKLDSKTFSMKFAGTLYFSVRNLIDYLSDEAYHEFDFREIGIVRTIRLTDNADRHTVDPLKTFTLNFADDYPFADCTYKTPVRVTNCWQTGFEIDGKSLSDYGIWIVNGTHDDILKSPSVKQNLLVNIPSINGAMYDGEDVFFQAKDVKIKCHIKADINTFWRNYNALLYDLIRPGERTFFYEKRLEEYQCHYKGSSVSKFSLVGDEIWCDFDLILVFTSFRLGEVEYILASEADEWIQSENGQFHIDVSANKTTK